MKILSFNACILPPFVTNANSYDDKKKERIKLFFKHVAHEYDVLLLQEVWDCMWSTRCTTNFVEYTLNYARKHGFVHSYHEPRKWYQVTNSGLMILSKLPISNCRSHTFQASSGVQYFIPNGVLACTVDPESKRVDKRVDVFVTHIHAGPLDSSFMNDVRTSQRVQRQQIIELMTFVRDRYGGLGDGGGLGDHSVPSASSAKVRYIIAGDFYSDGANMCDSTLTLLPYEMLRELIGSSSLLQSQGFPITNPIPFGGSFLCNPAFKHEQTCVDHVFVSEGLRRGIKCQVKCLCVDGLYLSDHAALHIDVDAVNSLSRIHS